MWKTVKPNDLLALTILWGLVIIGCLIGDASPAHRPEVAACVGASVKSQDGPHGG